MHTSGWHTHSADDVLCESEEVKDSEVDLSAFLERQRISEPATFSTAPWQEDDGDIDHDLDQVSIRKESIYTAEEVKCSDDRME